MTENKGLLYIMALGFIVVALAIMFAPKPQFNVGGTSTPADLQKSTISVTGQAQFDVDPDQAEVYLRVQTKEPTAKRAQDENARLMSTVKEALKKSGVADSEMETTNYNMWPQTKWNPTTQESEEDGYMVQHLLKVTTKDVTHVGALIETAVGAGANGLDSVNFKLSDKKKEDVNNQAISQASANAKDKAESITQGIGVKLGKIVGISESNVGYDNYPRPYYAMASAKAEGAAMDYSSNVVSPEAVTVTATIGIVYQIE